MFGSSSTLRWCICSNKYNQLSEALTYCSHATKETFDVKAFINSFWDEHGLKRSLDKIYEIIKPASGEEQKTPAEIIEGLTGIVTEALTDVSELIISGLPVFTELGINIIPDLFDSYSEVLVYFH